MPKYQYPSYVYDRNDDTATTNPKTTKGKQTSSSLIMGNSGNADGLIISTTDEERKAFLGEGPSSETSSNSDDAHAEADESEE